MKNNQNYEVPLAEVINIEYDIITTSGTEGPKEDGFEGSWDLEL